MAGTHGYKKPPLAVLNGYSSAAVTASQHLLEGIVPFPFRIGAVMADAGGAGTNTGNTVLDLLVNGTSVWRASGNRPTLAAASTGGFANTEPDSRSFGMRAGALGNVVDLQVASIPSSAGHTRVKFSVVLEEA